MELKELNRISVSIIDAAIEVYKELGTGLLESIHEICLAKEIFRRGLNVQRQVYLPVIYKSELLELNFRIDLLVEREVIVEIKSSHGINPVFEAQLLTYLKLSNKRLGLLLNFNEVLLKNGIKRMLNGY